MTDLPKRKDCQHDWEIENEGDIIDRFLFEYEESIKALVIGFIHDDIKHSTDRHDKAGFAKRILAIFKQSKEAQYELYRDTEEFDDNKEGCRGNEEDR